MRELIALQEACWERPWADAVCSYRNVHGTSFPPEDVDRMLALLREAFAQAAKAGDEEARRRIRWYASGFEPFLTEATALARRAKSGRTDFPPGATRELVVSCGRGAVERPRPWARTTVRSAVEDGNLRLDVRCEDPAAPRMDFTRLVDDFVRGNDCVMFIFGEGKTRRAATVYLTGEVTLEGDWVKDGAFEATVSHDGKGWSVAARIRPSAAERAAGRLLGNVCRWRVGDCRLPKAERVPGSRYEQSRLDTRYTMPNDDPAAYVMFTLR